MKTVLTILWSVLAVACIGYGITVMAVNSGSKFFLFWFAAGVVFAFFLFAVRIGLWGKLPQILKTIFLVIVCVGIIFFMSVMGLIISGFNAKPEPGLDYIIVLGAQVKESGPSVVLQYRLDTAKDYLDNNPETKCILTGCKGKNEPCSEAEGMANYLTAQGIDEGRIILEEKAENTNQNIKFSMQAADLTGKKVGIVTNNFHIYRALRIAANQGLEAQGIPSGSKAFYLPNNAVREFFGVIKDLLVGNMKFGW